MREHSFDIPQPTGIDEYGEPLEAALKTNEQTEAQENEYIAALRAGKIEEAAEIQAELRQEYMAELDSLYDQKRRIEALISIARSKVNTIEKIPENLDSSKPLRLGEAVMYRIDKGQEVDLSRRAVSLNKKKFDFRDVDRFINNPVIDLPDTWIEFEQKALNGEHLSDEEIETLQKIHSTLDLRLQSLLEEGIGDYKKLNEDSWVFNRSTPPEHLFDGDQRIKLVEMRKELFERRSYIMRVGTGEIKYNAGLIAPERIIEIAEEYAKRCGSVGNNDARDDIDLYIIPAMKRAMPAEGVLGDRSNLEAWMRVVWAEIRFRLAHPRDVVPVHGYDRGRHFVQDTDNMRGLFYELIRVLGDEKKL